MIFERHKPLVIQFIKYFGVALVGYIFDFVSLVLLTELFHVYYLIAASTGFVIGLIVTYILSGKYVFGQSKINKRYIEFLIFTAIGLVGLGILNLLMWIFTDKLGIYYILSKVIATAFVYIWNFFARRKIYQDT